MALAAVVVAHPVVWSAGLLDPAGRRVDSFPLSTFPMFAQRQPQVMAITHVVTLGGAGGTPTVPFHYFTRGGMNQARGQINRAANDKVQRGDPTRIDKLCRRAAKRVAREIERGNERYQGAYQVAVVRSHYDVRAYFEAKRGGERLEPQRRRFRHRCPIPGAALPRLKARRMEAHGG